MNYTAEQKFEALKNYLISEGAANQEELKNLTTENTYNDRYNTFEVAGDEYMVLTDEEANKAAKDEILNSLWAFNTNFILEHTEFYKTSCDREDKEFIKSLQDLQVRLCEGANAIVGALIIDIDGFISDAIDADGRGNFISHYDGCENEQDGLYIYRMN